MGAEALLPRARRAGNLPAELTTFVGRERELDLVASRLSSARLVTLVGPSGVGKTRLALRAAHRVRRAFADGTWLVDLAVLRDPALLAQHVAAALGLRDESGRWLVATLSDHLARRSLLLVLDNCEHLVDSCAALVRALLVGGSDLRILATSREPLGLTAEALVDVPPLDIGGPAVRLLADRASAVRPDFELTDATRPLAVELCRRLDGIPLAIELAAARLRGLGLEEIVRRLEDRFTLLSIGDRSAPPRQQTLRAALQWSHDLLTADQRVLWRRVAIFTGSFDTAAAEAICADDSLLPGPRVVEALTGLAERSVVQLEDPMAGRYRMLETLREYGALRAAEVGELDELRVRHRGHYLGLAQQAAGSWATGQQGAWFRRLSAEHANLRQALDDSARTPEAASVGLESAARLWLWWQAAGRLGEGRRWVVRLLEAAPSDSPSRALGLWAAGYLALVQRDVEVGERTLEHALAAARAAQDEEAESYAIGHLGLARLFAGSFEEARSLLHESVRRHRGGGRPGIAAFQLADAALAATFGGDTETALREFAASLAEARTLGDRWTQSHALWGLGIARWMRRETDQVDEAMREALASMREVRDPTGVALCLEGLALAAAARRDAERAAWLWGAAATAWEAIPVRPPDIVTAFREPSLAAVREALGSRRFQAHFDAGRATDVEDATALALGEPAALAAHDARREPPKLTRREQQVALLVADGLSNRDIGERLVLSPRTIESHVERIMNRLGVGSRAEIAAWAARELDGSERVEIP